MIGRIYKLILYISQGMSQYQFPWWDIYGPRPYVPSVVVPELVVPVKPMEPVKPVEPVEAAKPAILDEPPKPPLIGRVAAYIENEECFKVINRQDFFLNENIFYIVE